MKYLVTGAGGFIGSHLTEFLCKKGHDVKAFIRYNSNNNWGWLENSEFKDKIEIHMGDIRDYDSVYKAMKDVDVVFNLAALISIPYSYESPLAFLKTNTEGTYNILQAAKELNLKRVVLTSTSEIYGTAQYVPIDEKHPYNPQSPYAASKASADHLGLSYYKSFETPVTIIRPFNTFGPRQSARAVIPNIISQVLSGKKEISLGNLKSTRDFNFVYDTINGFYNVGLHKNTIGDVYNLSTNKETSIGELVNIISNILDVDIKTKQENKRFRPAESEVERLLGSCEKSTKLAGWIPKYTLKEGLKITCDWMKNNKQYYKPNIYNI